MVTPENIAAEHAAALASMNAAQRRAVARLTLARQQASFGSRSAGQRLATLFEREAVARSRAGAAA